MTPQQAKNRLEYLREELREERISMAELIELRNLIPFIDKCDVELLEAAGVPEISECAVKAIKRDGTNAVQVLHKESGRAYWIDIECINGDVQSDWNQYIFHMNDPEDVERKAFQENCENFELLTSCAIEFLENEGVLNQDEKGSWSIKNKKS